MAEIITKDFIERLYKTVEPYKDPSKYKSIFNEISDHDYRENYHSDILKYYLEYDDVRGIFINWLNENKQKIIDFNKYNNSFIRREEYDYETKRRIDIVIYSSDGNRAIIIENKSNGASDQPRQLYSYYKSLTGREIVVDAIFYLNKNEDKIPDFTDLEPAEKNEIEYLIISANLEDFIKNVIDIVINSNQGTIDTNVNEDINKLKSLALSYEIKNLLNSIINGENNMNEQEKFVNELLKIDEQNDPVLKKLGKILCSYNALPEYFREKYKNYLIEKSKDFLVLEDKDSELSKYWLRYYNGDNKRIKALYFDIVKNNSTFTIEIDFYIDKIICELWVRKSKDRKETLLKLIEIINKKLRNPFVNKPNRNNGCTIEINNTLDDKGIKDMFDKVIEYGRAISELTPNELDL